MIIVVGAGIAGLSLGYELVKRGAQVTVLEANTIASGASGIATSYLEPRLGHTPIRQVEWAGLAQWPDYAREIEERSGVDVGLKMDGQLRVTLAENETKFDKDLDARAEQGWNFQRLGASEAREIEPELSNEITKAAFLPNVGWVNGNTVCMGLAAAIRLMGSKVLENCGLAWLAEDGKSVSDTEGSRHKADKIIFCNGMGANAFADSISDLPVSRPVRGVNLIFDNDRLASPVKHLIKHHRGNMCPRMTKDGTRLIVGTTYEPEKQLLDVEQATIETLLANASPILPELSDHKLVAVTAGLRTKVGDGNLRLGRSIDVPNVYFSLSHAGAGFLRTPAIAPEFAEFVLNGTKGRLTGFATSA